VTTLSQNNAISNGIKRDHWIAIILVIEAVQHAESYSNYPAASEFKVDPKPIPEWQGQKEKGKKQEAVRGKELKQLAENPLTKISRNGYLNGFMKKIKNPQSQES